MAPRKKAAPARTKLDRFFPWLLLIGGAIGVFASLMLTIEVFHRLTDPSFVPVCNLNPVLSCTSVADSRQSEAFGFPNYFIGIAGYAVLATTGAALLAGAQFKRWFWAGLLGGLFFGIGFVTWLQYHSLYSIGALCLYCMIVWAATIPMFWYTLLYSLRKQHLRTPDKLQGLIGFAQRHHADILVVWFLVIIILIGKRFWYYWSTLF